MASGRLASDNGWKGVEPGFLEMDLVAHCGGRMEGPLLGTLVLTDVASGWSECVPLPSRDGLRVHSARQKLQKLMPLPIRVIEVDNDTALMNEEIECWCAEANRPVALTRSRAYKSKRPSLGGTEEWHAGAPGGGPPPAGRAAAAAGAAVRSVPLALLETIRTRQAALVNGGGLESSPTGRANGKALNAFQSNRPRVECCGPCNG
jgi:hypothetical protein